MTNGKTLVKFNWSLGFNPETFTFYSKLNSMHSMNFEDILSEIGSLGMASGTFAPINCNLFGAGSLMFNSDDRTPEEMVEEIGGNLKLGKKQIKAWKELSQMGLLDLVQQEKSEGKKKVGWRYNGKFSLHINRDLSDFDSPIQMRMLEKDISLLEDFDHVIDSGDFKSYKVLRNAIGLRLKVKAITIEDEKTIFTLKLYGKGKLTY